MQIATALEHILGVWAKGQPLVLGTRYQASSILAIPTIYGGVSVKVAHGPVKALEWVQIPYVTPKIRIIIIMPLKNKQEKAAYMKEWRAKNKTRERELVNARRRKHCAALKIYLREVKNKPCADCGQSYPYYVMDFDHRKDKKFLISQAVRHGVSFNVLKEEIAKCDLVCANCHRIRTYSSVVEQ